MRREPGALAGHSGPVARTEIAVTSVTVPIGNKLVNGFLVAHRARRVRSLPGLGRWPTTSRGLWEADVVPVEDFRATAICPEPLTRREMLVRTIGLLLFLALASGVTAVGTRLLHRRF